MTKTVLSEEVRVNVLTMMQVIAEQLNVFVAVDKRTYNDQRALINSIFKCCIKNKIY